MFLPLVQIWTMRSPESCKQGYDFSQIFFCMKPSLAGWQSLVFTQLSCQCFTGEVWGVPTHPLTFEHQGIVVMDLEAQISGGAWATKGKTCFFRVVESLEGKGVLREWWGGFPGDKAEMPWEA